MHEGSRRRRDTARLRMPLRRGGVTEPESPFTRMRVLADSAGKDECETDQLDGRYDPTTLRFREHMGDRLRLRQGAGEDRDFRRGHGAFESGGD